MSPDFDGLSWKSMYFQSRLTFLPGITFQTFAGTQVRSFMFCAVAALILKGRVGMSSPRVA